VYSPYFNVLQYLFFQEQKCSNGIKVLVINILCFGEKAFQSSEKVGDFTEARCVFVRTNFSSCTSKDDLAFFCKKEKKRRNLFFCFGGNQEQ
jgi:hypothetical protein